MTHLLTAHTDLGEIAEEIGSHAALAALKEQLIQRHSDRVVLISLEPAGGRVRPRGSVRLMLARLDGEVGTL